MRGFSSFYFDRSPIDGRVIDVLRSELPSREISFFFVHGGGWSAGTRTKFHRIAFAYCDRGYDCACAGYRLQGVDVFDQVEDIREGIRVFAKDLENRNRPARLVVVAESAGAHLALLTALLRDEGNPPPAFINGLALQSAPVTFEPWPDIFPAIWQNMQSAVGVPYSSHSEIYARASPIYHLQPGNPPMFFLEAENEHMFPLDVTDAFIDKAKGHGVHCVRKIYPRVEHGFFYSLDRPQQRAAFEDIAAFADQLSAR